MRSRNAAQAVTAAGWCAGMALILDGWPWPAALAVPAVAVGTAVVIVLRGQRMRAWLNATIKRGPRRRPAKTGAVVERA